jgi:hypothetical protein
MLQLRETRIVRSSHMPVLSSQIIEEEGMALVYVKELGETKVQKSTGAAGEVFAGVSLSRHSHPGQLPYVQDQVVPASNVVTLARTPIPGQLLVRLNGTICTLVAAAPAAATEVQLVGADLHFNAAAGKTVSAQFQYTPTVIEARTVLGDAPIGGLSSSAEGVIGQLKDAVLGTNHFDASADWSNAMFAKLAANGSFTVGTDADHLQNVVVHNSPNAANPFLVLSINVA